MTTIEMQKAVRAHLNLHANLTKGLGDKEAHCSFAAINLAISGALSDHCPDCASDVIWRWGIAVQAAAPSAMRNSPAWRELLPLVAGTGKAHEQERRAIVMDWMWATVLPYLQPTADEQGCGAKWRAMCEQRTARAAWAAWEASEAAAAEAAEAAAEAAAQAAVWAWEASEASEAAAAEAAAKAAVWAAEAAAEAAEAAAKAAVWAAAVEEVEAAWAHFDAPGLLKRLIEVGAEDGAK